MSDTIHKHFYFIILICNLSCFFLQVKQQARRYYLRQRCWKPKKLVRIFTNRQQGCGKVMFSQLSVILSRGWGGYAWSQVLSGTEWVYPQIGIQGYRWRMHIYQSRVSDKTEGREVGMSKGAGIPGVRWVSIPEGRAWVGKSVTRGQVY